MSSYVLLLLVIIPLAGSFFALTAKNDRNYAAENVYNVSILSLMLNVGMVLYGFPCLICKNGAAADGEILLV